MIALAVIISFGAGLGGKFVAWDDQALITGNPHINPPTLAGLLYHWTHADFQMYIPVVYTAWWDLAHVPGSGGQALNPAAFHAANLLVHTVSAVVVFELLMLLIGSRFAACAGALIFAVHPLQTEAVAWATGLKDCLSGMLALLAIWQYLLSRRTNARWRYALASAIFVLALLAKPSTVAVPVICAVLDCMLQRASPKVIAAYVVPWLVVAAGFAWVAARVQPVPQAIVVGTPWQRPLIAADSLSWYLIKLVWPVGLTIDYSHTPAMVLNSSLKYEAVLIVVVLIGIALSRRREYIAAGLVFVVVILPVSGLMPFIFQRYSTVADRYAYLAMLGVALAVAAMSRNLAWRKWIAPVAIVVGLLMVLSIRQTLVWRDTLTLFTHAIQINPNSLAANRCLGFYWAQNHDDARAATYYQHAALLHPDDPTNHFDYANLLLRDGRIEQALAHYRQAVAYEQDNPAYFLNYGVALMAAHRPTEALEAFTRAADIDPNNVDAYQNAGLVLEQMGALDAAKQAFAEALKRDPTRAIPRQHLQRLSTTQPKS